MYKSFIVQFSQEGLACTICFRFLQFLRFPTTLKMTFSFQYHQLITVTTVTRCHVPLTTRLQNHYFSYSDLHPTNIIKQCRKHTLQITNGILPLLYSWRHKQRSAPLLSRLVGWSFTSLLSTNMSISETMLSRWTAEGTKTVPSRTLSSSL